MTAIMRLGFCLMFALTTGMVGAAMIIWALWHIAAYARNPNRYDP